MDQTDQTTDSTAHDAPDGKRGRRRNGGWVMWLVPIALLSMGVSWFFLRHDNGNDPSESAGSTSTTSAVLDEAKQKAIWDAEHVTFKLESRFGRPFVDALVKGDAEALVSHAKSGFQAHLPDADRSQSRTRGEVVEETSSVPGSEAVPVDSQQWAAFLVASAGRLENVSGSRLQVTQIQQRGEDQGWRVQALLTIRGKSSDGERAILEATHAFTCQLAADEQIGHVPILTGWTVENESFRRRPTSIFEDVTDPWGLGNLPLIDNWMVEASETRQYKSQIAVADYDRDGYLDCAIATYKGRPILLKNVRGQRFVDVTQQFGLQSWESRGDGVNSLAGWVDIDGDRYPELIIGGEVYANEQGRAFRKITASTGLQWKREPMGMAVADYDCDGRLDIYVLYQMRPQGEQANGVVPWVGDSESGVQNTLWRNVGNGRFEDVTATSGAGAGARKSFAASWMFFDEDAYPDLYVANDFGPNVLLRNTGHGTFEDISVKTQASDFATSMGVASGDLNNDGYPELYVANMYSKMGRRIIGQVNEADYPDGIFDQIQGSCAGNRLYQWNAKKKAYQDMSEALHVNTVGWAYAPSFLDVNNDGLLDLYATTGFMSFDRRKPDG